MTEKKKRAKRQKPEDFIGWKSPDGRLEVIGIDGKQGTHTTFRVACTECSKDPELFPDGYFVSVKSNLVNDLKPCGCGKNVRWFDWQYLILARRAGEKKGFIVHGFTEEFKNQNTKLNLECLKDGHKWIARINDIINSDKGCPKCSGVYKPTEQEALQKCIDICKEMDYDVVGFVDKYRTTHKTRFEYICKTHGKQNVSYHSFVNQGSRCNGCAINGYSTSKHGTFYVYQWTKDSHSFIKFGITNQKELARIKKQKRETEYGYKRIWSATLEDGSIPLYIENFIKNSEIEIGVVSKEEFQDGFTETSYINNLVVLENLITDALYILTKKKV
ncbi:endonuclease [Aeromonas phage 2L372X]|uniref:CapR homology domain-containing protein n=2 Tax=Plateaulakevirus TaxID=2843436 RepID=A0A5B9N3D2_9CAUD|nr:endonuclease [Aeromonas phage 2L372D]YP_009846439.1 endonuclease [Aeromonas phage 2L372X]QDB74017.1 hypothetical protein 2L372D_103 [Aeromonas phage 2L372D]QEG08354.1 hypothetical protein [Aeromonas phage 2L372X]